MMDEEKGGKSMPDTGKKDDENKADEKKPLKRSITLKNIIFLQLIVIVFTFSGVAAKMASGERFLSPRFILFFGIQLGILGIYAILWQQIIKRFDLSVAYANRAMAIMWSMLWAVVFFHEEISVQNVIGVLIVIIGIVIVNSDGGKKD